LSESKETRMFIFSATSKSAEETDTLLKLN